MGNPSNLGCTTHRKDARGTTATAGADLRVIRLAGVESETRLGFGALHRLLRPFLDRIPGLPVPQRDALSAAFGLTDSAPPDRYLVGLAILNVLADVAAEQPMLCLVDDVHWLDRESCEALAFTARRLHADSLIFIFTARREIGEQSVFASLATLRLGGLAAPDAKALLASHVAGYLDAAAVDQIVAGTGGNPLALLEITARLSPEQLAGVAPLPAQLPAGRLFDAHFRAAIAVLPPDTRTLLLLIAAAPADDAPLIWRAAGWLGLSARTAQPAAEQGIVTRDPQPGFRHPLIRSAVYADADPVQRRLVHAALAGAYDSVGDAEWSAWHRAEAAAGTDEQVAAELEAAAERARARGGFSEQALFLSRAAELSPAPVTRAERRLAAADAHVISGDPAAAEVLLDLAAADVDGRVARARALRTRAVLEMFRARVSNVPAMLMEAVAELGDRDPRMTWDLLFQAMHAAMMAREHVSGTTLFDVAKATATAWHDPDAPVWSGDLVMVGLARRVAEGHAQAAPVLRTALARLRGAAELRELGIPLSVLISFATDEVWDIESRRELTERLAAVDRGQGALYALSLTLLVAAQAEITAGRFAEAEACYAEADEFFAATGFPADGAVNRAQLFAWSGREDELRGALAGIASLAEAFGQGHMNKMGLYALSILDLGLGRYQSALDHALTVFRDDPPSAGNLVLPVIIEAGVRTGNREAAAAALTRMAERARDAGTPWGLGLLARCEALMSVDEHAEACYRESVSRLGRVPVDLDLAHTRLLFGEWLRRGKRRGEARAQLRAAHQVFESCGAVPFAERARAELLATGEHVRNRATPAGNELTAQERHVAVLAAGGHTNAEIAERLFITVSTVEFHLNKVFRKLAISSRRQIAALIAP
ncbi:helix-turn-helix transcriptional regulator [Trebonia kvetii]|uniref:Helix-turn-helix transcriptional regulator n=1 Tax=Trebonia kvetii TaxID=2480626 RepID=A0A6P2C515_9ACTN|nr:helix-turn-helix transcriptional regulator [Trebonia kvetii]TVZ06260.1 helix-turn-helix transcriptional regulator [Trebonia kvetii]